VEPSRGRAAKHRTGRDRLAMLSALFRVTENTFAPRRQWRNMQLLLERADLPLRTVEFTWLLIGSAFVLGLFAALLCRGATAILASFVIREIVTHLFAWKTATRRMRAFEDQLPDLLITMAASLKAGHSFKQGIQSVVDEGQDPAAKELRRVLTDTQLGRPMEAALQETADRIGSKNFYFVITAVNIHRQVGGSLAGMFDIGRDGSPSSAVRAEDPLANGDGPHGGVRADRAALLHRNLYVAAKPDIYGSALPHANRPHADDGRSDDDGVRVTRPQKNRLLQGVNPCY
jgi:hypothetical protein